MANYYTQTVVNPSIPNKLMAPLELWLLQHIFEHEPDGDDKTYFCAGESPNDEILLDDDEERLRLAIEQSRPLCPDLCDKVEKMLATDYAKEYCAFYMGEIGGYDVVLQSIVKRHHDELPYITVEAAFTCSSMRKEGFGGYGVLISKDAIDSISTTQFIEEKIKERGLEA